MLFEHGRNATFYSKLKWQKGVVDYTQKNDQISISRGLGKC